MMSKARVIFMGEYARRDAHQLNDLLDRWRARYPELPPYQIAEGASTHQANNRASLMSEADLSKAIRGANRAQLYDLLEDFAILLDPITYAIKDAKDKKKQGLGTMDAGMFRSLLTRRKYLGARHQVVLRALAKLNTQRGQQFPQIFVEVAAEVLPDEMFQEIKRAAIKRQKEELDTQ